MNHKNLIHQIKGKNAAKILKEDVSLKLSSSDKDGVFTLTAHIDLTNSTDEIRELIQKAFGEGSLKKFSHSEDGNAMTKFDIKTKYSFDTDDKDARKEAINGFSKLLCGKVRDRLKIISMELETISRGKHTKPTENTKPSEGVFKTLLKKLSIGKPQEPALGI